MSAQPRNMAGATELGGGFILVERQDGECAVLAPHVQSAGVLGMMSPKSVNARSESEVSNWLHRWNILSDGPYARVHQVHGTAVLRVPPLDADAQADGMWSDAPDQVLGIKAADCAPVWLVDTASQRFALLHAGWRGAAAGIIQSGVEALRRNGSDPAELVVAIGPHLQACCFEVGPEVAEQFSKWPSALLPASRLVTQHQRSDSFALDLAAVICEQLRTAGVRDEEIFTATACTRCNGAIFHSYRRNGAGGPLMAAIAARRA